MSRNLTPKYLRNDNGKLMHPRDFLRREARGWGAAFGQVLKEFAQTGKQAVKETAQFVEDSASGSRKKGRK